MMCPGWLQPAEFEAFRAAGAQTGAKSVSGQASAISGTGVVTVAIATRRVYLAIGNEVQRARTVAAARFV